jgi:hypothetical protein
VNACTWKETDGAKRGCMVIEPESTNLHGGPSSHAP